MVAVVSSHRHELVLTIAGVDLLVVVEGKNGDPALARDFADRMAQGVEDLMVQLADCPSESEQPRDNLVQFPLSR